MTPAIKPLLLHAVDIGSKLTDSLKRGLKILREGVLTDGYGNEAVKDNDRDSCRWKDPEGLGYPVFTRLGMPPDIENICRLNCSIVLALDARILRTHAFQLNVGWHPAEIITKVRNPWDVVGELRYPLKVLGQVHRPPTDDASLFAELKAFDKARRRAFSLNANGSSAENIRGSMWSMSNEILLDGPVSLTDSLRVVFAPATLPPTHAAKLRALVKARYPDARVETYTPV